MTDRRSRIRGEAGGSGDRGRWSPRWRTEVVPRALRGEDREALSRGSPVPKARLGKPPTPSAPQRTSRWRRSLRPE